MRIAYLDLSCGISGDMFLAAMIDAGLDVEDLRSALRGLAPGLWELTARRVTKGALAATKVDIVPPGAAQARKHEGHPERDVHSREPHDHGHSHGPGHHGAPGHHEAPDAHSSPRPGPPSHPHAHEGSGQTSGGHHPPGGAKDVGDEADGSPPGRHHHHHHGRSYPELRKYVEEAELDEDVRERTLEMLRSLAEAEAAVHGVSVEEIHFHEVGGLDTIVDLAGAVAGLKLLGVERVHAQAVPWSHGWVNTAHGRLQVPAPATVELLRGLPVRGVHIEGETVTPTGAVLCRHLVQQWGPVPRMVVRAVGLGAGTKDFGATPNVLRLVLGEQAEHETADEGLMIDGMVLLAANIDDMAPELFEPAVDAAFAAGAADVWLTPIYMKRGRPAVELQALVEPGREKAVARALLSNTTTLGVRIQRLERTCLPRELKTVATAYGELAVKVARMGGKIVGAQPEYRDCVAVAEKSGATVKEVYMAALAAAQRLIG